MWVLQQTATINAQGPSASQMLGLAKVSQFNQQ